MTPQHSNRQALVEGTLRCLEERQTSQITAREIAAASNANLASIGYHFGSTDALIGHAMAEGFNRWFAEFVREMGDISQLSTGERIQMAAEAVAKGTDRREGLVRAFLATLARAPHDSELRSVLAKSYEESRLGIASLAGLGTDQTARDAASLLIASFDGLLIQAVLDPDSALTPVALRGGVDRLTEVSQT